VLLARVLSKSTVALALTVSAIPLSLWPAEPTLSSCPLPFLLSESSSFRFFFRFSCFFFLFFLFFFFWLLQVPWGELSLGDTA